MYKSLRDRRLERTINEGGMIQSPPGSGKKQLASMFECVIDGDFVIKDYFGQEELKTASVLIQTDRGARKYISSLFEYYISKHKLILTSFRPEMFGVDAGGRYSYHPCEYPTVVKNKGLWVNAFETDIMKYALAFDPSTTIYMDVDEDLSDYILEHIENREDCPMIGVGEEEEQINVE